MAPYPAGLNDCVSGLKWTHANAATLGIDPARIVIAGESGGGNLTLASGLKLKRDGDIALIKAERADRWGNLVFRKAARNFNPVMATAAACTVVQTSEIVALGALDPESIVTPGIFVKRVVQVTPGAAR